MSMFSQSMWQPWSISPVLPQQAPPPISSRWGLAPPVAPHGTQQALGSQVAGLREQSQLPVQVAIQTGQSPPQHGTVIVPSQQIRMTLQQKAGFVPGSAPHVSRQGTSGICTPRSAGTEPFVRQPFLLAAPKASSPRSSLGLAFKAHMLSNCAVIGTTSLSEEPKSEEIQNSPWTNMAALIEPLTTSENAASVPLHTAKVEEANPQACPGEVDPDDLTEEVVQLRRTVQQQEERLKEQASNLDELRSELQGLTKLMLDVVSKECFQPSPSQTSASAALGTATITDRATASRFQARLDKSSGQELGLELDEETLRITVVDDYGLVADWNEANPGLAIVAGNQILEVNGEQGVQPILNRLIRDSILQLTVSRR